MTAPMHAPANDPPAQRRPGLVKAMLAPWRAILSPRVHSPALADCSSFSFWTTFVVHTLVFVAVIVVLILWSETVTVTWPQVQRITIGAVEPVVQERTWSQAWSAWTNQPAPVPGPYLVAMLLAGTIFVGHVVLAWLYLIDVHEGGSVVPSFGRAFRGAAASMGMLVIISAALGISIVLLDRDSTLRGYYAWEPYATFAGFLLGGVQIAWIRRTCEGARRVEDAPVLPSMCEDCGYDLTHRPERGRCTECGGDICASLTPGARRNPCAWERWTFDVRVDPASGRLSSLAGSASSAVLEPVRFYRELTIRSNPSGAVSFARWQYAFMAGTAAVWMLVTGVFLGFDADVLLGSSTFAAVGTVVMGWLIHRTVGSMALNYCFLRGMLPDPRYARKVFAYETAFLWVFCLYNGFLATTFFVWEDWMSDLFGRGPAWLGGMPPEVATILFGNAAIVVGWLYRYRLIIPQVRWANF